MLRGIPFQVLCGVFYPTKTCYAAFRLYTKTCYSMCEQKKCVYAMVNWPTSFHLRIWKHYHPLMSFFHYYFPTQDVQPRSKRWCCSAPMVSLRCLRTWWSSPKMILQISFIPTPWENPAKEQEMVLLIIVHPWSEGVPGPGEASAPRLTSRRWIYCWSHLLTMIHGNVIKESCFVSSSDRNWSFAQHTFELTQHFRKMTWR